MLKYIAIGLFCPFVVFIIYYASGGFKDRKRVLEKLPLIMLACVVWSFIPSLAGGFLPFVRYNFFVSNIFFFHWFTSRLSSQWNTYGLLLVFMIFLSLFVIYVRQLGAQERVLKALKGGGE